MTLKLVEKRRAPLVGERQPRMQKEKEKNVDGNASEGSSVRVLHATERMRSSCQFNAVGRNAQCRCFLRLCDINHVNVKCHGVRSGFDVWQSEYNNVATFWI